MFEFAVCNASPPRPRTASRLTPGCVTVIAKLTYGAPAWSGLCSANDRARLDAFLRRTKRYGYCSEDIATISDLFTVTDESLFKRVLHNDLHVLQPLLPAKTSFSYNLRPQQTITQKVCLR